MTVWGRRRKGMHGQVGREKQRVEGTAGKNWGHWFFELKTPFGADTYEKEQRVAIENWEDAQNC